MSIPAGDLTLLRSTPQTSTLYLVIQQAEYSTDDGATWTGYDWSCRVNGNPADDPEEAIPIDGGAAAADLLDGQTVLVGSSKYGDWDKGVFRLRGDQTVGPATTSLNIGTSSDVRGHVTDDDYVVVLDEFRFWQRYGAIEIVAGDVVWYKDYDIEWDDIGAADAERRAAMMPPVPVMGPHAVKFVDADDATTTVYFDWQDSYAPAPGEAITDWVSQGETDHVGGVWNSVAQTPGWQTVGVSGLAGFRTWLRVWDGNGTAVTVPFRRGIRYVFTLRRPGETQVGDPDNAEPITEFEVIDPPSASAQQGYWRTSIRVFASEATKYNIMPEALVILFTDDVYGSTAGSLGPIEDRENILLVGRIVAGTIRTDPETGDVSFDVASPGAEAALYHNYPIVIQNDDAGETWIDTPDLTVDRAVHYYTTWHTNLTQIADLYQTGSTIEIYAQDFLEGDIYSTLNQFLWDRLFARLLCDKYGRFHCEIDANERAFGGTTTLWTMQTADWLEEVVVRQNLQSPVNAVECGGLIYDAAADPVVTPKLSRAPGVYDRYRGVRQASNALAITSQNTLNTSCGRHLSALNHEFEADFRLAGNWRYCDIAPQRVVDVGTLTTDRETLTGDYIIRAVTNGYDPITGTVFTEIQTEQEADDGVAGVTIVIPDEMPDQDYDPGGHPGFGGVTPIAGAYVPGEYPADFSAVQFYTTQQGDTEDYWTDDITANPPVWNTINHSNGKSKTTLMYSSTTNRFFGYGQGIWEYSPLPFDTGAWAELYDQDDLADEFGHLADYDGYLYVFRMQFSIRPDHEDWAWAGCMFYYTDGGGDTHVVYGVLHTRDAWTTIQYAIELCDLEEGVDMDSYSSLTEEGALALDMHSNTVYVFISKGPEGVGAVPGTDGWWRLYRSQDFGQTYQLAQTETGFEWGTDGYDSDQSNHFCDLWVPWVSNSYAGGAVYWTTTMMQETNVAFAQYYVPMVYRSLSHGVAYEEIGDDGGLESGLNFLGGPYNSLDRVYGGISVENGVAAEATTIYTWLDGAGWSTFRDSGLGAFGNFMGWIVAEQSGYTLSSGFAYQEPYFVESGSETDKQCTESDVFWQTWVP